jgi:hypothetical protein
MTNHLMRFLIVFFLEEIPRRLFLQQLLIIQNDYGERVANGQKVLEIKSENEKIAYVVPKNVNTKGFNWNFKNGMLEVEFKK